MANRVYPELVRALTRADVPDLQTVNWVLQAFDGGAYDAAHLVLDDFTGTPVSDPMTLDDVVVVVNGESVDLVCDPTDVTGITSLETAEVLLAYIDTGDPATSTLGGYYDRRGDTSPVTFTGTGDPIPISFPSYFIRL
jgi:hypothetical protein